MEVKKKLGDRTMSTFNFFEWKDSMMLNEALSDHWNRYFDSILYLWPLNSFRWSLEKLEVEQSAFFFIAKVWMLIRNIFLSSPPPPPRSTPQKTCSGNFLTIFCLLLLAISIKKNESIVKWNNKYADIWSKVMALRAQKNLAELWSHSERN